MATAKIITEGNIQKVGSEIRLAQKNRAEEYQVLPDEEILKISDRIIERNIEAYKELAK